MSRVTKEESQTRRASGIVWAKRRIPDSTDYGKAQVLRDAGWSIPDIMEEMWMTEEDILEHTHEPKPKKHYENEFNVNEPAMMRTAGLI